MGSPGLSSSMVKLAPSGHLWVATTDATAPTDVTTTMASVDTNWSDLGLLTDSGMSITPSISTKDVNSWQQGVPAKVAASSIGLDLKFELLQYSREGLELFLFGATFTVATGTATTTLSSNPSITYKSVCVEWTDDDGYTSRLYVPKTMVSDYNAMVLQRTDATTFPMTLRALDSDGDLATLLSNDPHLLSDS